MPEQEIAESPVEISVRNIGGIDETAVEFEPGVTILTGRNATNRTSFLRAVMAALGSDDVTLKGDADRGTVELTVADETYSRTLSQRQGTTVFDGEPYLHDPKYADLFAFLLESNDARRAVERGDDLYDVIMRPVDTDEIDAEIDRLDAERQDLEAELETLDDLEQQLPSLEEERTQLETEIDQKRDELDQKRAELAELEADAADASAVEDRFDELRETRNELDDVRRDIEDEERIVDALNQDIDQLEADLDGLAEADDAEHDELEADISRHRESIQKIESTLSQIQSAIQFNESLLGEHEPVLLDALHGSASETSDGTVTDKLLDADEDIVCWTCGSPVHRTQIEETLELLQGIHRDNIEQRNQLREEIDQLEAERKHVARTKDERRRLQNQLDESQAELDERNERIDRLEADAEELEARVEELEAAVAALETDAHDERLTVHREANELEFELDRLESRIEAVAADIESIEDRLAGRGELDDRLTSTDAEIEDLRSHIERLETEAVERFNEQMDTILALLEFDNLERIWIERLEREGKDGRRRVMETTFDLHVVRTTDSGSVYDDTVNHLSESEREVVGLVFALSGYLVHEVYERVPFMLLDSLEALDSERLATMVDHFAQHVECLVVALLPEDAAALDEKYQRVTDI